ncbi:MAG: 30S ribosomal protein S1 [Thermoanaerobaculales bacterium]|jgi:small subunit ribosomal protein S1|nr:30S ribosomal protein S1 [Thermoanaerobaculales bacterium]
MDPEQNNTMDNEEGMDQLSMEELMESSLQSLREGEVVNGTVVAVNSDEVLIDIGYKCEGSVPINELTDPETGEPTVAVNDVIEVFVERLDESEGRVRLSRDRATKLKIWGVVEEAYKNGEIVTGKVLERVKGGLAVDIGIRAFLPGSLVDMRPNRRLEDYVDQEIEARVISFDRRRSNVVLSRKAVLEEEIGKIKEETMADLEEGKLVNGVAKNITDYGVFVDLGGLDGLLHITDISWGRVGHPSEYFKVGDEVDVVVLRFDRERERVSLGYKQRFEDPWILVPEKYPVGKRVHGEVVSIVDYGAFIALEEGVEGLVHVSEMSWTKKVKNPRSILEIGQEIDVVVSEVDAEKRRLSLSLRAIEPNPWEQVADTHHVGSRIKGVVRNLTDFGAFVEIVPGVDGLVHISDMSWTRRINHPSEVVQKGEEVEAVITSVDVINQRISLSMKELLPNEWEEYANAHGVGDLAGGVVTNVTDFGVFVELAPGVEGLCHISEIDRDGGLSLADTFVSGQKVTCRILRIDWNENRIGLSMHSVDQDDSGEVIDAVDAPAVETAMAAAFKAGGIVEEEIEAEAEVAAAEEPSVDEAADTETAAEQVAEASNDGSEEPAAPEESDDASAEEEAPVEEGADEPAGETDPSDEPTEEAVAEDAVEEAAESSVDGEPDEPAEEAAPEEAVQEAAESVDGEPDEPEEEKKADDTE